MGAPRFGVRERELLRQKAVANWQRTQELARSTEAALRRSKEITASSVVVLAQSDARTAVTDKVDRAIHSWLDHLGDTERPDEALALVASAEVGELRRFSEILAARFPRIIAASDVGTTLGLAIAAQPDIAVLDTELELGDGVDAALTMPLFSPHTRVLALTDDAERADDLRIVGLGTEHRHIPDAALLAWVGITAP
jgi:CheY-like chemotaxis protein